MPTRSDSGGAGTAGPPMSASASPRRGAPGLDAPPRGPSGRGRRARQATTARAPRAGCSALRAERSLPLVCKDRFRGTLYAWRELAALVGDGPGQVPIGELGPGDGFRLFRTKGDDGGMHRRRRQVNRVFMSWRFDRPDFLDLGSHSGCRASGRDGRYIPLSEVTPLIVVLHSALRVRPAVCTRCVLRFDTSFGIKVGGSPWVALRCGDRGQPIDLRALLPWLADFPHLPRSTGALLRSRSPALAG